MKKSIIWNISNGVEFPVELWKHPKLAILINNVPLKEFKSIELNPQEINLFFISAKQEEWSPIEYEFIKMFGSRSEISLLLLSQVGNTPIQINTANKGNLELLESPIRKKELKLIMEKTIQAEFYKTSAVEIGSGCLQNVGFFEGLFELAHAEYKNSQDIIHAFEKMLEYESKIKSYNNEVSQAIMRVNEMREAEMLTLVETIKANEKLDLLREKELKEAIEIQEATEKALQYSRIEEMNMDKILRAHDRIFKYSEQEIKDLIKENIELKKKLGIKVEE